MDYKVLEFYTDDCVKCKEMEIVLKDIECIEKINALENKKLTKKYGIMSVPTFILLKDDEEVSKKIGTFTKEEFYEWIKG